MEMYLKRADMLDWFESNNFQVKRESDQKKEINNFRLKFSFRFLTKKLREKMYLIRISRKSNKGLKNMYLIADEQHWEEIAECEINNTQVIRFLKASKLEFYFLEKLRPKVIEKQLWFFNMKQSKWTTWNGCPDKERKKKGVKRILPEWWPKRPRNCWMWNQQLPKYKIEFSWESER